MERKTKEQMLDEVQKIIRGQNIQEVYKVIEAIFSHIHKQFEIEYYAKELKTKADYNLKVENLN